MTAFLQFVIIGAGLGSAYALFAQGVVLIYRGSGIVNFAQGGFGALAAYLAFLTCRQEQGLAVGPSIAIGIAGSIVAALAFDLVVLRLLTRAAPIVRVISTLGLMAVVQAAIELEYGNANHLVEPFLPHRIFDWGGVAVQEQVLYIIGITVLLSFALWVLVRFSRVGLAISAAAENERAVQTLGWSPRFLSMFTWGLGAAVAGIGGVLIAPLSGLSTVGFTLIISVASLAAALLGGFRSFPLTLLGGMVVGMGESLVTLYEDDIESALGGQTLVGLNRAIPFFVIMGVLVIRGRGLPLRSHTADRLPRLGSGRINVRGLAVASAILLALLFLVFDDRWAAATYLSLSSGVVVLSVIVLTGYAGQLSLAQWALAGTAPAIAAQFIVRADWPMELAIPVGIALTVPVGLLFALPALRTRGVNLAVVTLCLGFAVAQVVFANNSWMALGLDNGTPVGPMEIFGWPADAATHPHRWAFVCLVAFVAACLVVANLRRSRTGRRLVAVRTNERAAASLGVSVLAVKLYAFAVAAAIAGLGGVLFAFQASVITYGQFNVFSSINAVSFAVIGGIGYVLGAAVSAPNAIGGLGTMMMDWIDVGRWDALAGGVILLVIILAHQDGVAHVMTHAMRPVVDKLRLRPAERTRAPLEVRAAQPVDPVTLRVESLTVRFGGVTAVRDVSFDVKPGEVVGLIGPNGAGKTTIIDAVTGFVRPAHGTVRLNDQAVEGWTATRRARHGLRRSFQSLELFDDSTVGDNIRVGADAGSRLSWLTDLVRPGEHALPDAAVVAIHEFSLEQHLDQLPEALPHGTRRLVAIARTVASGPSVVMLDEPATGLDTVERRELAHLIRRLADERRMGVLLVEHDVGLVMSTCDRVVVLDFGRVICTGSPERVRRDPAVRAAYLGSSTDGAHDAEAEAEAERTVMVGE